MIMVSKQIETYLKAVYYPNQKVGLVLPRKKHKKKTDLVL